VFREGQFAHDLIYESALASVPLPIARQLHAELARYLQAHDGTPARIADHWLAAQQWEAAGQALRRAAVDAGHARRWREQADLLAQAVACFERTGDRAARFEALLARVDALVYCDLGDETLACARAAEAAAADEAEQLRATLALLQVLTHRGDVDASIAVGQRGLALAHASGDRDAQMRLALPLSGNLCDAQRAGEALALLEPLRGWADRGASPAERCEYHIALGMALDQSSRLTEAIGALEQACAIARAESLTATLSEALSNLASAQAKTGRVRRAVELGRQAVGLMTDGEPLAGRPIQSQLMLAHRLRDLGRYAEALPMFETALAAFEAEGSAYWRFAAAHRLALAFLQLGQYARAGRLLAEEVSVHVPRTQALWAMVRAELARLSGPERRRDALGLIRQALDLLGGDPEDGAYRMACLFATAIVPPDEGEALATALAAWANARERYGLAMAAHVRAAGCALAQEAPIRALPHAEAALRLAPDYEADSHYRGELWLTAARTMRALDDRAGAEQWVQAGRAWIDSVARAHVPAEFRDSFLNRNPVNRDLLALATGLG
jgi:tetratricopeptide (TPR) repeat protein